mmetsp:Transcript_14494/g.45306  ORF Transcript_14494/g.45306 Transcript_14494/m.45306 type:complete len:249 (+) Transcript_14494:166-912(+)
MRRVAKTHAKSASRSGEARSSSTRRRRNGCAAGCAAVDASGAARHVAAIAATITTPIPEAVRTGPRATYWMPTAAPAKLPMLEAAPMMPDARPRSSGGVRSAMRPLKGAEMRSSAARSAVYSTPYVTSECGVETSPRRTPANTNAPGSMMGRLRPNDERTRSERRPTSGAPTRTTGVDAPSTNPIAEPLRSCPTMAATCDGTSTMRSKNQLNEDANHAALTRTRPHGPTRGKTGCENSRLRSPVESSS